MAAEKEPQESEPEDLEIKLPKKKSTAFLQKYPFTATTEIMHDLIKYIHAQWKATKSPPDFRTVIRRTSNIIKFYESGNKSARDRKRKFENAETSGFFSVPWEPYKELGVTELDTRNLLLNNLVPTFKVKSSIEKKSRRKIETRRKKLCLMPSIEYSFDEKDRIDEMTSYDLIKSSLDFIKQIREDIKYPERHFQSIYHRRKKEIEERNKPKAMEMVFIPFKAVEDVGTPGKTQDILNTLVKRLASKLNAIVDITHTLLNFEDADIQSKLPLRRLAMIRLKYTKKVAISKLPYCHSLIKLSPSVKSDKKKMHNARILLGHPPPLWQNKFQVTGIRQFEDGKVCMAPNFLVNHLKGMLLRSLEKIRRGGIYLLERLEGEFERRFKYTSLALAVLPLTLIQQPYIWEYANYLKTLSDKAAFARANEELSEQDRDMANYLLHDISEVLKEMLKVAEGHNKIIAEKRPKAIWFQMLENEAKDIGILKEPEIQNLLKKIYQFHNINLRKVKFVEEKFCLAVISTPIEEVCNKHWQEAAKFVHERMLEANEGMIEYWLAERGLPKLL